ncbi:MAG: PorV/PorQ family protein [Melioribacteraceae bacterium]|nr:PorV/PorQ family protein [Melioribacteraceae bacterium]
MKNKLTYILLITILFTVKSNAQLFPTLGGQRAGISTLQFLKIGIGGRATAMGDAFIAVADDASALYWNPAGLAFAKQNEVMFSHNSWFAGISQEFVGGFYKLTQNDVVGISLTSLYMDDMKVTDEFNPFGTGQYFSYGDVAVTLSYSRKMTEQFSVGASIRYVEETLDRLKMRGVLIDIGTMYWTGLGSTRFAVAITNFGNELAPDGEVTLWGGRTNNEWQAFSPPTMFRIGFAFEPLHTARNRITTSVQLNHPNDNSENISIGAEYSYAKIIALRGGYKINADEQSFTAGAGVKLPLGIGNVSVDYAFASFTRLGSTHRFSIIVGLY